MPNLIYTWLVCCLIFLGSSGPILDSSIPVCTEQSVVDTSFILIQKSVVNAISTHLYGEELSLVQFPSQGNFEWQYEDKNGHFNSATFDYISARLAKGDIPNTLKLSPTGGFANAYATILKSTYYHIGKQDQKRIDIFNAKNVQLTKMIVFNYESLYGTITSEDLLVAQNSMGVWLSTKIDYVIQYQIAGLWSGALEVDGTPIPISELGNILDVNKILPNRGINSTYLLSIVRQYVLNMNQVTAIIDGQSQGNWMLHDALSHLIHPDSLNGGINLVDPISQKVGTLYEPAYDITQSSGYIEKSLFQNPLEVQVTVDVSSKECFLFELIFSSNGRRDTINYEHKGIPTNPNVESLIFRIAGITLIDASPEIYHLNPSQGWFGEDFIKKAMSNQNSDRTGYRFATSLEYNLSNVDEGGDFGYIDKLMVCSRFELYQNITNSNINNYKKKHQKSDYLSADPRMSCSLIKGTNQSNFKVHFTYDSPPLAKSAKMQSESYVLGIKGVFPPDY